MQKNNTPMVSVITTVYNHELFITKALAGVLNQKVNFDMEYIISDDSSTDGTREKILDFLHSNSLPHSVQYIRHERNKGMKENFVWTLKQCKGKYIAICEGDDYWTDENKLQMQVDFLENWGNAAIGVFTTCMILDDKLGSLNNWYYPLEKRKYTEKDILYDLVIPTCTMLFQNLNSDQYDELNNPNYIYPDMILWLTLLDKGSVFCIPVPTAIYRRHHSSVTARMTIEDQVNLLKQHEEISKNFSETVRELESIFIQRQSLILSLKFLLRGNLAFSKNYAKKYIQNVTIKTFIEHLFYLSKRLFSNRRYV